MSAESDLLPLVWVDPQRQFGKPCVWGTRVPVATIAGEIEAGASWAEAADDYAITPEQAVAAAVVGALNPWMRGKSSRKVDRVWDRWVEDHMRAWHHGNYDAIPEPPFGNER